VGSTLFGICLTSGLHWYRGMVVGLAIQSVMGPLSLIENPLARSILFGKGLRAEDKIFGEKTPSDLTPEDEIVDSSGNPVALNETAPASSSSVPNETKKIEDKKTFEEVLLDTWDEGVKADLGPLMALLTDQNCNFKSKDNSWTPLMIVSGLVGVKGCDSAIKHLLALGADPSMIDTEGWNAMHWAAFHGSIQAAKTLAQETRDSLSLWTIQDKEGKTPRMLAESENNVELIKFLVELEDGAEDNTEGKKDR
jgi:Ankyrin repeats (3 copies)/Phosphate transport (Pho88)